MFYTIFSITYQANYKINDVGLFLNLKLAVSMAFYPVVPSKNPIMIMIMIDYDYDL